MDIKYLDELVQNNKNLAPLTRDTASRFVDETIAFFKEYGPYAHYYRRGIQVNPPLPPTPWKDEGRIIILSAQFDLDDVDIGYVDFKNHSQNEESLYINLHTKGATAGYVFVPAKGLYLRDEVGIHANDRLLTVSK